MNIIERILNRIKSRYVNNKVFSKEIARHNPIYISYKSKCVGLTKGCIELNTDNIYKGMIQFGIKAGPLPAGDSLLRFENNSKLVFNGKADFLKGTYLCVFENAKLEIGNNIFVNSNSIIHCHKSIIIGDNNMWGWNILVKDSDGHPIYNSDDKIVNRDLPISIGDEVWLGSYSRVLKGAGIPSGCVVGMNSVITNKAVNEDSILVGIPAKEKKTQMRWDRGEMPVD